jgi:hypothetical protein
MTVIHNERDDEHYVELGEDKPSYCSFCSAKAYPPFLRWHNAGAEKTEICICANCCVDVFWHKGFVADMIELEATTRSLPQSLSGQATTIIEALACDFSFQADQCVPRGGGGGRRRNTSMLVPIMGS